MQKYLFIIFTMIFVLGCSNGFDEAVKIADNHFDKEEFVDALSFYEQALEEKDNQDVQMQVAHLKADEALTLLIESEKWTEADEAVELLMEERLKTPLVGVERNKKQ